MTLQDLPVSHKPILSWAPTGNLLESSYAHLLLVQLGRICRYLSFDDYSLVEKTADRDLILGAADEAGVPVAWNMSPYFRYNGCTGCDPEAWTPDDQLEMAWIQSRLALASAIPQIQAVIYDQECAQTMTPRNLGRLDFLETMTGIYLPNAAVYIYGSGGTIGGQFPAFEYLPVTERTVRWYSLPTVVRTEGVLETCRAKYSGEQIQVLISLGCGYTLPSEDYEWTWGIDWPKDEYWRAGNRIRKDPGIASVWMYPGPFDVRIPGWLQGAFVPFVKGMAGVMLP